MVINITNNYTRDRGGITTYILNIEYALEKRNIPFKTIRFGHLKMLYPLYFLKLCYYVIKHNKDEVYILSHSSAYLSVLSGILACFVKSSAHIYHSPVTERKLIHRISDIIQRNYIFVSRKTESLYAGLGITKNRNSRIVSGGVVESELIPNLYEERNVELVLLGRFVPEKGFLDFFRYLRDFDISFTVAVYGTAVNRDQEDYRDKCKTTLEESNCQIVYFGEVENSDIATRLNCAKVVAVTSIWDEPAPMVVPEANSVGVPVVSFAVGGMLDRIKPGVNGLVVTPFNYQDMVSEIEFLLDKKNWEFISSKTLSYFLENSTNDIMLEKLLNG
jgi:glycosyltransferase involved in cell wall biosynthesis